MAKLIVTYARGKPFERDHIVKIVYSKDGQEVTVSGDELLTHDFPLKTDLTVYASDGKSIVSCQGLRAISAFEEN